MSSRKPKLPFRAGQRYRCSVTGRVYTIERRDTNLGMRFLLVSFESGNPGTLKSPAFIQLQIEDGLLVRETRPVKFLRNVYHDCF